MGRSSLQTGEDTTRAADVIGTCDKKKNAVLQEFLVLFN